MSTVTPPQLMTTEQLLAMPDDGVERELINGVLKEYEMTRRNPRHSGVEAIVAALLFNWIQTQPHPRGRVFSGEVGVRLRKTPDTTVGIDVAYFSAESVRANAKAKSLIDGPPILAVEILSPSDQLQNVWDKVETYLNAGVHVVWVMDPVFRTVTVSEPDQTAITLDVGEQLTADKQLPGFTASVESLFEL